VAVLRDPGTALPLGAREEREDLLKRSLELYRSLLPSTRPEVAEELAAQRGPDGSFLSPAGLFSAGRGGPDYSAREGGSVDVRVDVGGAQVGEDR
jgi:hypothetical protein